MKVFISDLEFRYLRVSDKEGNIYGTLVGKIGDYNITLTSKLNDIKSTETVR